MTHKHAISSQSKLQRKSQRNEHWKCTPISKISQTVKLTGNIHEE